jgi:NADH-quinone oxidoreductase subunit C
VDSEDFDKHIAVEFFDSVKRVIQDIPCVLGNSRDELEIKLDRKYLLKIAGLLKDDSNTDMKYLRSLSIVDWIEDMEAVYHLSSVNHSNRIVIKIRVPMDELLLDSVIPVWKGADWHEREANDLFGVRFRGHPNMAPLILYDGFEGFPGRKSYELAEQDTFYGD